MSARYFRNQLVQKKLGYKSPRKFCILRKNALLLNLFYKIIKQDKVKITISILMQAITTALNMTHLHCTSKWKINLQQKS